MTYQNRLIKGLTVFAGVAALLLVPMPMTATAGAYDGYCDSNEVCVYQDTYLGTPRSDFLYNYADMYGFPFYYTYNYPSACNTQVNYLCILNDSISSIDSWSDHRSIRFFVNSYYDGAYQTVPIYGRANTVTHNDAYSSECWNDGGVPYSEDPDCTFSN
jgi:hypothetical protein